MADTLLPPVPESLLDAVNALLNSVGLASTDTLLDTDTNLDAQKAFEAMKRANAQVQATGWHGNTEDFTLTPDPLSGIIPIAPSWLRVRPKRWKATWINKRITTRSGKLYNMTDNTFDWTGSTVYVEAVIALDFEDLPQALRWYITCRAGRAFGVGTYPTSGTFKFTQDEELRAKTEALQEDEMLRDQIMPESSPHFDNMRRR